MAEVAALSAKLQLREVVTEVAVSTTNIELPLWEVAMVDGPGGSKKKTASW